MFNITFQQVEAFLAVGMYANLSKAAQAMYISQSALSKMLQRFEEGIDVRLLVRSNQGISFTDEGRFLYSKLTTLFQSINDTIKTAQNLTEADIKTIRIVMPSSFDASTDFDVLRRIIGVYQEKYPDVILDRTLYDFGDLRRVLELGETDLAFAQDFTVVDMKDIAYKRVTKFELCIAASAEHRICEESALNTDLLQNEYFYTVPIPGNVNEFSYTLSRCRKLGFIPKGLKFVPNMQTLVYNVRQKNGVAICGRYDLLGFDDIKYYPLPEPENQSDIVVAWKNGKLTGEAQNFINLLPEGETFISA